MTTSRYSNLSLQIGSLMGPLAIWKVKKIKKKKVSTRNKPQLAHS